MTLLASWVLGVAVVGAVLVPDFGHGPFAVAVVVIQLVVPLLIVGPVVAAVLRRRVRIPAAAALTIVAILVHCMACAALYRVRAGYAAFHDGVTVPSLIVSGTLQFVIAGTVFVTGAIRLAIAQRRHAA